MTRRVARRHAAAALIAAGAAAFLVGAAAAETGTVVPVPTVAQPDPLRSPIAPYRGRQGRQPSSPSEEQQLRNYRTDLQSRQRDLEQARPNDTPRLMEERRELQQELDRVRRLTR